MSIVGPATMLFIWLQETSQWQKKGVLVSVQLDLSWLVHHFLQRYVAIGKVQASVSPCPSDFISWAPS